MFRDYPRVATILTETSQQALVVLAWHTAEQSLKHVPDLLPPQDCVRDDTGVARMHTSLVDHCVCCTRMWLTFRPHV